ncbi:MAG: respiratory nitrate reductase subunit gamma [Solirubrobacterales bacterium]
MKGETIIYVILPYVAITVFVAGLIWRWRADSYGWNARSTQLLEGRVQRYASVIFHFGVLAAIGGHVLGILIPAGWTSWFGLSEGAYHVIAVIGGVAAGGAVIVGLALLIYRRIKFPRVRATTSRMDVAVFTMLAFGIVTGMLCTLTNLGDAVHYRETVAPYFRQLFILDPQPELMTAPGEVTLIFQVHVVGVWFLYMLWPFSRLVHAFSAPVGYFRRSPIVYRPRTTRSLPTRRPESPTGR